MVVYPVTPLGTIPLIICIVTPFLIYAYPSIKKYCRIFFKIVPFYNKLETVYGAKYPSVMDYVSCEAMGLSYRDNLCTYFYVSNSSFIIVNITNPENHIEIPFDDVLYQNSILLATSRHKYEYAIAFKFLLNDVPQDFRFVTLEYNHRIDKYYGNRLNGEDLFNFMRNNFKTDEHY